MMYKIVNKKLPSLDPSSYFEPQQRQRRIIKLKQDDNFSSENILTSQIVNNNKGFKVYYPRNELYKNSYFIRTIIDWNNLSNEIVFSNSLEGFKRSLVN